MQHLEAPALACRQAQFGSPDRYPLSPERFVPPLENEFFICPICKDVLQQPLFAPPPNGCEHRCCRDCWKQGLAISLSCPVCQAAVTPEVLSPIFRHEWTQFCSLQLHCDYNEKGCQEIVAIEHLTQHTHQRPYKRASFRGTDDPQLREPKVRSSSGGLLIDAIRAPATKPLSREEDEALGSLLDRKTTVLGSEVAVPIYIGGRPRHISFMTKASPMQSEPSKRTMRCRHQMVRQLEEAMSGNALQAQEQRVFGLKQMTKDERHQLLFSAKISHAISQEDTLAMKTSPVDKAMACPACL